MDNSARFVTKNQRHLSYSHGLLPFNYLGVFIFMCVPELRFLEPFTGAERLKDDNYFQLKTAAL